MTGVARPSLADLIEERRRAERKRASPLARVNRNNADRFARWHVPEAVDHEPDHWLITYLDLLTLLLAMLVVMLGVTRMYGWHTTHDQPIAVVGSVARGGLPPYQGDLDRIDGLPAIPAEWAHLPDPAAQPAGPVHEPTETVENGPMVPAPPPPPSIEDMGLEGLGDSIQVVVNSQSVSFRISTELLFPSGQASLSPSGLGLIKKLAGVVNRSNHPLSIEGHSDNVPIQTRQFPSNWELSTSRATSVLRELVRDGVDGNRLRAVGYADTHPLQPNDTAQGRAANRRVELIMRTAPKESDATQAAAGKAASATGPAAAPAADAPAVPRAAGEQPDRAPGASAQ
ncbi:OmpA-family protein [Bordetella ansorpii]|uniref:OmpA-family protein n=1 Tax=Bordetella ansorpii TaxID=288768 RepID=A0A157SMG3_9BORD|nr:OmpA family protein [Bordetella ansorpii]SAI71592.1 OmpA-family protein [Bordetella ansorpii]